MKKRYSDKQLTFIRKQAMIYQCACPAQICESIENIRMLYKMQESCLDINDIDKSVHECIKETAEKTHDELEQCLATILQIEGWDMNSLIMPAHLSKRLLDDI